MTQTEKIIKPKVGLLELATQLGNVSQACKIIGYWSLPDYLHTARDLHLRSAVQRLPLAFTPFE